MKKRPCLNCKQELKSENKKYFPFCSERCKMVDLGEWAFENYKITKPISHTTEEGVKD